MRKTWAGMICQLRSKMRFVLVLAIIFGLIIGFGIFSHRVYAGSRSEGASVLCYHSLEIQHGDTLWQLCDGYIDAGFPDRKSYIREVCRINHIMEDDCICDGDY